MPSPDKSDLTSPCALGGRVLLFGTAYFISAHLGAWFSVETNSFTPFWPPGGIFLAVLLLTRFRQWPWFIIAAIAGNIAFDLTTGKILTASALFSLGNSLEAAAGAWAIRKFLGAVPSPEKVRDIVALVVLGALISALLSATVGSVTVHYVIGASDSPVNTWLNWWSSDALSILLFTPLVLTLFYDWKAYSPGQLFRPTPPRLALEKIGWTILFLSTLWLVFLEKPSELISFNYLLWPLLIWAGLRFRMQSILLINLFVALFGAWTVSHGLALFTVDRMTVVSPGISLHFFLLILIASGLVIAAISIERRSHQAALSTNAEQFRAIFNSALDGILVADPLTGRFRMGNRAILAMTGYAEEEIAGLSIDILHPSESHDLIRKKFRSAADGSDPLAVNVPVRRKDGTIFHADINAAPFVFEGKNLLLGIFRDVAERWKQEEQLRLKTEELDRYFTSSLDLLCIADTEGRFRRLNPQWKETLGYDLDELEGKRFLDLVHPDDLDATLAAIATLASRQSVLNFINRYHHKNGSWRWIEWRSIPEGNLIYAVARDITDRKASEAALRESEARLTQAQRIAALGHYMFDVNAGTWTCSPMLDVIFGIDAAFPRNIDGWLSIIHPDDQEMMRDYLLYHVIRDRNIFDKEYRIIRPSDGATRWMHGMGSLEIGDDNHPVKMFGTIQDITSRKSAEAALVRSEQRYRSIVENLNDAFYIHDFDGTILDCNDNACRMLGYTRNELIGSTLSKIDSPTEAHLMPARMKKLMISGTVVFDGEHIRKDGSKVSINVSGRIVSREGNGIAQSFVRDISDGKLAEQNMMKVEKLESLGQLAGGIAHDFNNLLAGIFGNIDLAQAEAEAGRAKPAATYLSRAIAVFDRAKDLTRQLLTFSKGGAPVRIPGNIAATVRESVSFALTGSNCKACIDLPPDLWTCEYDPHQIEQVIENIVLNARQAMPGGGDLQISAENVNLDSESVTSLKPGPYVRISIRDNGIGIPAEYLQKIFDPFFSTKQTGSGLGLATSWSIIKRHGGHIDVTSTPGKGSTFFIYLPASPNEAHNQPAEKAGLIRGSGRLLLMDDEPYILEVTSTVLAAAGYAVVTATHGMEAIKTFSDAQSEKNPFCAVILDLTIPGGMGGRETIVKLKELDPAVCAIASSGYADDPVMADPVSHGFVASISKPYRKEEISGLLARVLGIKE